MDVYIQSEIGVCAEFVLEGKKREVSIVISPVKVEMSESQLKVVSGCNMWRACENRACYFSLKARLDPKVEKKQ